MRIGIFDSGIGGLTVLKSLINRHPNHSYYYFGDSKNLPYGSKSKDELLGLSKMIIDFLIDKEVDLIIIACGTVSSNIYEELKGIYNIPIFDIINPTIKYIKDNNINNVGIIATSATINSKVFENKLDINVISKACPMFVPMIEKRLINTDEFNNYLDEYLSVFKNNTDALVLGCTHYPLISNEINKYLNNVLLINMGDAIANHIYLDKEEKQNIELYFSKVDDNIMINVNNLIGDYEIIEKEL